MKKSLLTGICLAIFTVQAQAKVMAPAPVPNRVALADCIVVGKITAIETKTVPAKQYPSSRQKNEYKVAVIAVEQGLKGAKGITRVRLGFIPPAPPPPGTNPRLRGRYNRFPQLNHKVGQEALFFLSRHFEEDFFVARLYFQVVDKKDPNLAKVIAETKSAAKLLESPMANLQSKNADDRLKTAAMVLTRYRTIQPGSTGVKHVPLPAAESKLILDAIRTADWKTNRTYQQVSPQRLFQQLGLTKKDGWPPRPIKNYTKDFPPLAQEWLRKNADTYRIKKFVAQ